MMEKNSRRQQVEHRQPQPPLQHLETYKPSEPTKRSTGNEGEVLRWPLKRQWLGLAFGGSETNVDVLKCAVKESAYTGMCVTSGATVAATQCNQREDRFQNNDGSIADINADGTFTHAVVDDDDGFFLWKQENCVWYCCVPVTRTIVL